MKHGDDSLRVFGGNGHPDLTAGVCAEMGVEPGRIRVERFPDGEIDVRADEDVRGTDTFIIQPTSPPVNENLMELLVMIDCVRRASADRITAVIPYFGYARKDRKDEGRVPITAKLVSNLIVEAGASRVLTIDLHASQIQGFFDVPVDHLYARPVLIDHLTRLDLGDLIVVAPDTGSIRLARAYAKAFHSPLAIIDKRRVSGSETVVEHVIGEVDGCNVLMIDDMISTGGTICDAVRILKERGASDVHLAATHGVFAGPAKERLAAAEVAGIHVTDTIPLGDRGTDRTQVCSVASLLARAIQHIHRAESVSSLFEGH